MDPYASDDEQLESLKSWWKTNGLSVITGIVIGLAIVLGWQYWSSRQASQAEQAAQHYMALLQAVQRSDPDQTRQQFRVLRDDFADSAYAVLAALQLARLDVENNDKAAALEHLQWALDHTGQEEIKAIARLRLARVLLAEGRHADAEAQLDRIQGFTAEVEELRGDLYLARNEPDKARLAYQTALTAAGSGGALLQIKLDNLPPAAQTPAQAQ